MWKKIKTFFKDSETIFWARLQAVLGFVATTATYLDPSLIEPLLTPTTFAVYMLINGLATEWLRRRRAEDL